MLWSLLLLLLPGEDLECGGGGGASSTSMLLPHFVITQSGASRSVSPDMERMDFRLLEERNSGLEFESWYLSAKRAEGRVR